MRKKFTMLLMSLLACVGVAKAQTATIVASTDVDCPETQYAIKSGNGYWMYKTGAPTDNNPGRFAFFAAEGENAYKIYSLDLKQWVSYDPNQIGDNVKDFTTLIDSQEDAKSWHVTSSQNGNRACYQFQPYNANGKAQNTYMNWNGGVNVDGGFAYQDDSKKIGLWKDAASKDGGSAWMLTHVVAPETGEYALKDLCGTYLDIHNLGKWPDGEGYERLATMQDEWQSLYITVSGNGWDWSIHTTAEGGDYLHQTASKEWNSWVSDDGASFVWKAELSIEEAKATELYYSLRHESGVQNGYLGANSHTDGNVLYVNQQDAAKKLKLTLILIEADALLDEARTLLEANETNHAEKPTLGQYTTAAYNALAAVCGEENPAQDAIENALREFKKSLNIPVYMIKSAHDGYAKGSAIYYDGAWKWNTVSRYNRQMWMTISGHTQVEIPVVDDYDATGTHYEICDYLTGNVMRDKKVQIVKIEGWDGVYNLQYSETDKDAVMHAKDTKALVGWNPATATDAKAGAWTVEYIGNTYDLDKMTEEKAAALIALEAAVDANTYLVGLDETMFGDGLGKYSGDASVVSVYYQASQGLMESLSTLANMETSTLNDYLNAINSVTINKPATGKFYRVKSMNAKDEDKRGKYWQVKADATAMELNATVDASNSIIYLGEDNTFLSYGAGQFLNNYTTPAAVEAEATAWNITKNLKVPGTYALYRSGDSYCLSDWNGLTYGQNDANAAWIFEEVTSLPVAVSAVGMATLYAPVALEIPTGVKAYVAELDAPYIELVEIESGVIPANTGVVLETVFEEGEEKAAKTFNFAIVANPAVSTIASDLVGSYAKCHKELEDRVYTLQNLSKGVGFYRFNGNKPVNPFRAWVELGRESSEAPAMFAFTRGESGEGTTGIESVELGEELVIYDLAGRRVQKMEKGIYIVNGKKVVIK